MNLTNSSSHSVKKPSWYSKLFGPFGGCKSSSLKLYHLIMCLFLVCGPSTVFGIIPAICLNPIQSHVFGPFSHVSKEVVKTFPSFADFNSPASIAVKRLVIRVVTSTIHTTPRSISPVFNSSFAVTMKSNFLGMSTTTRYLWMSLLRHTVIINVFNNTTFTLASPHRPTTSSIFTSFKDEKPTVLFSNSINNHNNIITNNVTIVKGRRSNCG